MQKQYILTFLILVGSCQTPKKTVASRHTESKTVRSNRYTPGNSKPAKILLTKNKSTKQLTRLAIGKWRMISIGSNWGYKNPSKEKTIEITGKGLVVIKEEDSLAKNYNFIVGKWGNSYWMEFSGKSINFTEYFDIYTKETKKDLPYITGIKENTDEILCLGPEPFVVCGGTEEYYERIK